MKKKISIIIVFIILLSNLISNISLAITADDFTTPNPEDSGKFEQDEIMDRAW